MQWSMMDLLVFLTIVQFEKGNSEPITSLQCCCEHALKNQISTEIHITVSHKTKVFIGTGKAIFAIVYKFCVLKYMEKF